MPRIVDFFWEYLYTHQPKKPIWGYRLRYDDSATYKGQVNIFVNLKRLRKKLKKGKKLPPIHNKILTKLLTIKKQNTYNFEKICNKPRSVIISKKIEAQPDSMGIKLYGYQLRTLQWMKEVEKRMNIGHKYSSDISLNEIIKNCDMNEHGVTFDIVNKSISYKKDDQHLMYFRGGILADEMGLGKTVTTIALMLSNSIEGVDFMKFTKNRFSIKANFIVCPSHLTRQWAEEIKKCNPLLKVLCITTKPQHTPISYRDIMESDAVITSFEFLTNPSYYISLAYSCNTISNANYCYQYQKKALNDSFEMYSKDIIKHLQARKAPFYEHFHWHRVIVDEGHEIFNASSSHKKYQQFEYLQGWLKDLSSTYRWYVSGTPFINEKGFSPVMDYLEWKTDKKIHVMNSGDFSCKLSYTDTLKQNIYKEQLYNSILDKLYIRNTKDSVGDEYDVPPIAEETILLNLIDLERNLYEQAKARKNELHLRQMCCHPQISENNSMILGHQQNLSLEDVRQKLVAYNRTQLETEKTKLSNAKKELASLNTNDTKNDYKKGMFKRRIKRCDELINQYNFTLSLFENIDPLVPVSEDELCSICLGSFTNLVVTECGHFYCKECINSCLIHSKKCPLCRKDLTAKMIYPIKKDNKKDKVDYLVWKYGSKIGKLIELCRKIMNNEENRIIIFSQWDRMLVMIGDTLRENSIETVYVKGHVHQRNAAIRNFKKGKKKNKETKVIMLSLKNAASGTNLIEATHVILMDPIAGSKEEADAIEGQAIGRASRLGQNKQVKVIRLITKDTIEEQLHNR